MNDVFAAEAWRAEKDPKALQRAIGAAFGEAHKFRRWLPTSLGHDVPTFSDGISTIEWVLASSGEFWFGLTESEERQASALSNTPLLTVGEMQPAARSRMDSFLFSSTPLCLDADPFGDHEVIGADNVILCSEEVALRLAVDHHASLMTEREWEYECRGGSDTLFWFGSALPQSDQEMESLLGFETPVAVNSFGMSSMFFGEWCDDIWRTNLRPDTPCDSRAGRVIRGGAARFWPWQDPREWAGCVSAFRMPSRDAGGAGAAVRLVRRPHSNDAHAEA